MKHEEPLIPPHGGYRKLKSFQLAQLVHDVTVRFCNRYVSWRSRTRDQMVQAARSGAQNIAEGSNVSATSKKSEMRLTKWARASLEELRVDYKDFLRQRGFVEWHPRDPRRDDLVARRCQTAEDVATALLDRQLNAQAAAFRKEGGFSERLYRSRFRNRNPPSYPP